MPFIKQNLNCKPLDDQVFALASQAKQDLDPKTVNATIGSLCDENHTLVAFNSVYDPFKSLPNQVIAKYAQSPKGNDDFLKAIEKHVIGDRVSLPYDLVATAGGTGALYLGLKSSLDKGDRLYIPKICWGNYRLIAEDLGLDLKTYDPYDLNSLKDQLNKDKVKSTIIINSPCQNPCGFSYDEKTWQDLIDFFNHLDQEIVLINDVAYIDYSYQKDPFIHLNHFNNISDNVLVLIAYSLSKAFTAYGVRLGALISISKDASLIQALSNVYQRAIRATISNVNNGFMHAVASIDFEVYLKEKASYVELLKQRSELFVKDCQLNDLDIYHYDEGFFVTIKILENLDEIHQRLLDNHIYTIKVNQGLRVAICSTSMEDLNGLAKRIKDLIY